MRILLTDDEPLALKDSYKTLLSKFDKEDVIICDNAKEAIRQAKIPFDIAFLDVEMPGMTGIELGKKLQKKSPQTNIVFLTAYSQYALEAYNINASNYCIKPLSKKALNNILENLRYSIPESEVKEQAKLKVTCFGDFNILDKNGQSVMFGREKAKELFAYLVYKNGIEATPTEICDALWGEDSDTKLDYFWKLTSELRKLLKDLGYDNLIIQGRGKYALDTSLINCDYYDYLNNTVKYSWNEMFCEQYGGWAEEAKASMLNI